MASNWQIEYGAPGFTPGTGTIVNATTNPYTVTGLAPSTYYDFWVRDSCGATDVSDWAGAFAAATACGTAVAPYLENFDNGFVGGTDNNQGHNIGATISPCWSRTDTDTNYRWGGRTGTTATGPTVLQAIILVVSVATCTLRQASLWNAFCYLDLTKY